MYHNIRNVPIRPMMVKMSASEKENGNSHANTVQFCVHSRIEARKTIGLEKRATFLEPSKPP